MKRLFVFTLLLFATPLFAQTVTVPWTSTAQTFEGMGGAATEFPQGLPTSSPDLADFFFGTGSGQIGLNIVRSANVPDFATCSARYGSSNCVASSGATIVKGDLAVLQQAQARGVTKLIATSWSPPGSMKSNGQWAASGTFLGTTTNGMYPTLAQIFVSYLQLLQANGVTMYAVSPQNEPNCCTGGTYQQAFWTAQQFHDFIPVLRSALNAAGFSSVKIFFPEPGHWDSAYEGYAATAMNDSTVAAQVGFMAQHGYAGDTNITVAPNYSKEIWLTEDSDSGTYDPSIANAIQYATYIHNYLTTAQVSAYIWWWLSGLPQNGDEGNNSTLTDASGNIPKRDYMTGNWSKFWPLGCVRMVNTATVNSNLITSCRDPLTGKFAITTINPTPGGTSLTFAMTNYPGAVTTVTPHITSSTQNLVDLSPITGIVGNSFTTTIPGNSIVTFTGTSIRRVSQSGGTFSGGSDCNGQSTISVSAFNALTLNDGDVNELCGVITTTPSIATASSGTATLPVTLKWDTGARITQPTCNNVCLQLNGANWLIIDGGTPCGANTACSLAELANRTGYPAGITGIIEATAAGSPPLANQIDITSGILSSGSNIIVKNLIIRNTYVHTTPTDNTGSSSDSRGWGWNNATNLTLQDSTLHDMAMPFGKLAGPNGDFITVQRNYFDHCNWCVAEGSDTSQTGTDWYIHDNQFGSMANWDATDNGYHHNPIFIQNGSDLVCSPCFTRIFIYNNLFFGDPGANNTSGGTFWDHGPATNSWVYNNVYRLFGNPHQINNAIQQGSAGATSLINVLNNTFIDAQGTQSANQGCIIIQGTGQIIVNNAFQYCQQFVYRQWGTGTNTLPSPAIDDRNAYGNSSNTSHVFTADGAGFFTTMPSWRTFTGQEANSVYNQTGISISNTGVPTDTSLNFGFNRSDLCPTDPQLAALCFDSSAGMTRTPTARPATGTNNWTVGAINFSSGGPTFTATLTPTSCNFGSANVGTIGSTCGFTFTNTGTGTLNITNYSTADTDYTITTNTCVSTFSNVLPAGSNCSLVVTFSPLSAGTLTGNLQVFSNATGSPQSSPLTGVGTTPTAVWNSGQTPSTTFAFGNVTVPGPATSTTITLSNTGTGPFNPSFTFGGANPTVFTINSTDCPGSLGPGASCHVLVNFSPTSAASFSATLLQTDTFNNANATLTLTGTGVASAAPAVAPCASCITEEYEEDLFASIASF